MTLAQGIPIGNLEGIGPLSENLRTEFDTKFVSVMSNIIGVMTAVAALWFVFLLLSGAIGWLSAGSDKQALDNAKKKLTNAIVGLGIVVAAYGLVGVVGYFFGIDIIGLRDLLRSLTI